jgi:hypothetical protein
MQRQFSAVDTPPGRDTSQDNVKLIGQSPLCEILPVWSVAQPQTASAAPTTSHRAFPVDNTDMAHLRIDPSRIRASTRNLGALQTAA